MRFASALAVLAATLSSGFAAAQAPAGSERPSTDKSLRLVVPFAAGGSTDLTARLLAQRLPAVLGQPVIVDNKPGAGTLIGTRHAAQAPADGLTLLLQSPTILLNSLAYKAPGYKMSDFVVVTPVLSQPFILSVHSSLPVRNLAELVAYSKTRPQGLNSVSLGSSSITTLALERFKAEAGMATVSVNYGGTGPALTALMGGVVDVFVDGAQTTLAQATSPHIRMLGITSERRSRLAPDLPTFKEQGFPSLVIPSWTAVFAPAATPAPVLQKLRMAFAKVLAEPQVRAQLIAQGFDPWETPLEEFNSFLARDTALWARDVKRAGLQLD